MSLATKHKIALAKAAHGVVRAGRGVLRQPMQAQVKRRGITWELNLDEGIDFAIYLLGAFEPELVRVYEPWVSKGQVVVDIGANIGAHTLHFGRLVGPSGRVVAVEATQYAYRKLCRNLALNEGLARRTEAIQAILAESDTSEGPGEIYSSWPLTGDDPKHETHGGVLEATTGARICTLDTIVRELQLDQLDWIKLDVDGNEWTVLQGASETLAKFRPRVLMEFAPGCHDEVEPGQFGALVEFLGAHGYEISLIPGMRRLRCDEAALRAEIAEGGSINVLLTPGR